MDLGSLPNGFIWVCNGCRQKNDPSNRELPNESIPSESQKTQNDSALEHEATAVENDEKEQKKDDWTDATTEICPLFKNSNALRAPVGKLKSMARNVLSIIQNFATNGAGSEQRKVVAIRVRNHAINFTQHYVNILLCAMNVTIHNVRSLTWSARKENRKKTTMFDMNTRPQSILEIRTSKKVGKIIIICATNQLSQTISVKTTMEGLWLTIMFGTHQVNKFLQKKRNII